MITVNALVLGLFTTISGHQVHASETAHGSEETPSSDDSSAKTPEGSGEFTFGSGLLFPKFERSRDDGYTAEWSYIFSNGQIVGVNTPAESVPLPHCEIIVVAEDNNADLKLWEKGQPREALKIKAGSKHRPGQIVFEKMYGAGRDKLISTFSFTFHRNLRSKPIVLSRLDGTPSAIEVQSISCTLERNTQPSRLTVENLMNEALAKAIPGVSISRSK